MKDALGNDDCAEKITPYSVFCTRCNTEVDLHGDSKRLKELELKLGGWRKALEGKGSYEGKEEAPFTEEERNDKSRHLLCKEWYATERWEKHKRACKGGRRG
jgi:hypothetical protein